MASTTTRLSDAVTWPEISTSAFLGVRYGFTFLERILMLPEMKLIGTSEYTMYFWDTFPARRIGLYCRYRDTSAINNAMPISFSEPTRYLPEGANVTRTHQMSSTGTAIRNATYGIIRNDNSCPT